MKISKNQLCYDCRKIRWNANTLIEEMLDSPGYTQNPFVHIAINPVMLSLLQENGGCDACKRLFERATKS